MIFKIQEVVIIIRTWFFRSHSDTLFILCQTEDRAGSLQSTPRGLSAFPERNRKKMGFQGPASWSTGDGGTFLKLQVPSEEVSSPTPLI